MSNELSPQRRKLVLLCSSMACFAALAAAITRSHPLIAMVLAAVVLVLMISIAVAYFRLGRQERS